MARLYTVLVACLAITGVFSEYGWSPDREYRYLLKGHELSGIPDLTPQYVGFQLRADVIIQPLSHDTLMMKMEDVRLGKLNERVNLTETWEIGDKQSSLEPLDLWNPRQKIPFRYEKPKKEVGEVLSKPIKIRMRRGVMESLEVPSEDPVWADNLRKSIASMLSLDMAKDNRIRSEDPNLLRSPKSDHVSYTSHEESVIGDCETVYTINSLPRDIALDIEGEEESLRPHQQAYIIKKVRDLDRCRRLSAGTTNLPEGISCKTLSSRCEMMGSRSSSSETIIRGDLHNFVIESIQQQGAKTVFPYSSKNQALMLSSRQTLQLKKIDKPEKRMHMSHSTIKTDLLMSVEKKGKYAEKPSVHQAPPHVAIRMGLSPEELKDFTNSYKLPEKVSATLRDVVKDLKKQSSSPTEENIMGRLITIRSRLEELSKDQLETIFQKTKKSEHSRTERKLLIDLLTMAGTNPCVKLLTDLIKQDELSKEEATNIVVSLPSTMKTPTPEIIEELYKLLKSDFVQKHTTLKYNTMLSVSRLIQQATQHTDEQRRYPVKMYGKLVDEDDSVIRHEIIPYLIKKLRSSESEVERIVLLKALGNTGQSKIIELLKKYFVPENHYSKGIKIAAIMSLRSMHLKHNKDIQSILLPTIQSPIEHPEVRASALRVFLERNPSTAVLQKIILDTYSDPSQHFLSVVSSTISSLAESHDNRIHSNESLEYKAALLLPLIKKEHIPLSYSKMYYFSIPKEAIKSHSKSKLHILSGSESLEPSSIEMSFDMDNKGSYLKLLEMGLHTEGMKTIANRIFGPEGIYYKAQSAFDLLRRSPRGLNSVEEELREISRKLNIEERKEEESRAYMCLKSGSSERFVDISEQILKELQEEGKLSLSDISEKLERGIDIDYHRLINLKDVELYYPSELGLPIFINIQWPVLTSVKGNIKSSFEPSLFESSRNGMPITSIKVRSEGVGKILNKFVALIGAVFPPDRDLYVTALTNEVSLHIPKNISLDIKPVKQQVDWSVAVHSDKSSEEMLSVHTHPVTSIVNMNTLTSLNQSRSSKAIRMWNSRQPESWIVDTPLGLKMQLSTDNDRPTELSEVWSNLQSGKDIYMMGMPVSLEHRYYRIGLEQGQQKQLKGSIRIESKDEMKKSKDNMEKTSADSYWLPSLKSISAHIETRQQPHKNYSLKIDLEKNPKIYINNISTPIFEVETTKSPQVDLESRTSLLSKSIDTEYEVKITDGQQSLFNMTVKKERTEEMKEDLKKSRENKQCEKDEQSGRWYSRSCQKIRELAAMTNKITIKFGTKKEICPIRQYLKSDFGKLVSIWSSMELFERRDKMAPLVDINPVHRNMTIEYRSPVKEDSKWSMPLSERIMRSRFDMKMLKHIFGDEVEPVCTVESKKVTTFDQVSFDYDLDDCWHLAVKDCTDRTNMAVLIKKEKTTKRVKVLIRNIRFEITPSSVKVNQEEQKLNVGEVLVVRQSGRELAAVEKVSETRTIFISQEYGLKVMVTGDTVRVHLTPMYRKNVCGLCGNMDGEKTRDLLDPKFRLYKISKYFGMSYSIPDGKCQSGNRKFLDHADHMDARSSSGRPHHIVKSSGHSSHHDTTIKVTDTIRTGDHICFSTRPLSRCQSGHLPDSWEKIKEVAYHCIKESKVSRQLEKKAEREVISKMSEKSEDLRIPALNVRSCVPKSHHRSEALTDKVMGCYINTKSSRREGEGRFDIENVDPFLCTHAYYAFATLDTDTLKIAPRDDYQDLHKKSGKGGYIRFTGLKKLNTNLRTMLSVGGQEDSSEKFSRMTSTSSNRRSFIMSVVELLQKYNFDGLDLVWEYPTMRGGRQEDKRNYVQLLKELRDEFNRHNFVLTVAIPATKDKLEAGYDIEEINKYVDFVNVMTYDYHGMWDTSTGHHTPLHPRPDQGSKEREYNVEFSVNYLLGRGLSPKKLVVGMGLYGRGFTLSDSSKSGLGAPVSGGIRPGPFIDQVGMWGDNEICKELREESGKWTVVWDSYQNTTYAYKNRDWIGFDNPKALTYKAQFVMDKDLAGAMVFSLDTDDFSAMCFNKKFHMTTTITDVLNRK